MKESWRSDNWFVSHYNFLEEARNSLNLPKRVFVHDITLRDGEQQAGIIFKGDEKIKIAEKLDEAGVPRIEAGLPAVSNEEAKAIKDLAHRGLNAKIFAFSRCMKRDVDLSINCDVDGVVMEIPSSGHLLEYAYGWTEEKAVNLAVEATQYAHEHGLYVAFFTIDSTRAKFDEAWNLINAVATEGHMDSLVIVDTFGVCSPLATSYFVKKIKEKVRDKPLEIHCHNDFGLAVANTIAAVEAGVEIVHTTVNAIGERSGNAALEETVMALELLYGVETGVKFEKLRELSKIVEEFSHVKMPPNKPIVGDGVFTTESGIIVGWWNNVKKRNMPLEVFPFSPNLVGHNEVKIILGKKSGKDSIIYKVKELGLDLPSEEEIMQILEKVKTYSGEKKEIVTDKEFLSIYEQVVKNL